MSNEQKQAEKPVRRRRELVPIATCKIRTGPGWDDAIQAGDEVPRGLVGELTEKKLRSDGKLPPIHHYEFGSYVGGDQ